MRERSEREVAVKQDGGGAETEENGKPRPLPSVRDFQLVRRRDVPTSFASPFSRKCRLPREFTKGRDLFFFLHLQEGVGSPR